MRDNINSLFLVAILFSILLCIGCSTTGPESPVIPGVDDTLRSSDSGRTLWGYYEVTFTPSPPRLEITPLRHVEMHLNALKYLEGPGGTNLSIESPLDINGNILNLDLGITHPLIPKLYCGFDVRAILITKGSQEYAGGYVVPGESDCRIMNPDGYTRFWNPVEFFGNGYQDGILGTPYADGNYNATVNGFKYYADGLVANDQFNLYVPTLRGAFSPNTKNIRHFQLFIPPTGLVFNYAVDASWANPDGPPPYVIPDSFDVNKANSKEAWRIIPSLDNNLTPGGGSCDVTLDVYDWQGSSTIEGVFLQAPDIFTGEIELTYDDETSDYATYIGSFTNDLSANGTDFPVFIRVPDTTVSTNQYMEAFQIAYVSTQGVVITLEEDADFKTPGTAYNYGLEQYDLNVEPAPLDPLTPSGPWDFTSITYSSTDTRSIYSKTHPYVGGFVNDFPDAVEYFLREGGATDLFRAEEHNEASNSLLLHGLHSYDDLNGSLIFESPAVFPYPYDIGTNFSIHKEVAIIPFLLTMIFDYKVIGVSQGSTKVPLEGGTWHNCLVTRSTIEMATGGFSGQGWMGTALAYEWIADDGTVVAMLMSANEKDIPFNFDPDTFEITGLAQYLALQEISDF